MALGQGVNLATDGQSQGDGDLGAYLGTAATAQERSR
jgi:hypothetical protein